VIEDALSVIDHYLRHRAQRLEQVREALRALEREAGGPGDGTSPSRDEAGVAPDLARAVVERVYADVDPVLWGAAELSVRAQIDYLRSA
jgi:hypothetical protein